MRLSRGDLGPLDDMEGDLGVRGDLSTGDLGAGDLGAGDLGASDLGAGDLGAGDLGAGDLGAGDLGAGDLEMGDRGAGDLGFGDRGEEGLRVGDCGTEITSACAIGPMEALLARAPPNTNVPDWVEEAEAAVANVSAPTSVPVPISIASVVSGGPGSVTASMTSVSSSLLPLLPGSIPCTSLLGAGTKALVGASPPPSASPSSTAVDTSAALSAAALSVSLSNLTSRTDGVGCEAAEGKERVCKPVRI